MSGTYTEAQVDATVKREVNDAHVFAYISSSEALGITAGTPEKITSFIKNILDPKKFTISGGVITYIGTPDIEVKLSASMSFSAAAGNLNVLFYFGYNDAIDTQSEISRKT